MPHLFRAKMPSVAKAHVRDAGVGDELLEVGLGQGGQPAVEDGGDGKPQDKGREDVGGVGGDRQGEPQEAVGAHLQQDAGEQDAAGGGASTCAAGSQVWKGNIGTLMAKEMKKARKTQHWKLCEIVVPHHVGDAEAADLQAERDDGDQQQHRSRPWCR